MHARTRAVCEHDVYLFVHRRMATLLHYAFLVPHVN